MLKPEVLKEQIYNAFSQYFPLAFEEAAKVLMPTTSEAGSEMCKNFGQTLSELLAEPMASSIAYAIDFYIKNASITGQIVTTGSPVTQTATLIPSTTPIIAGTIPNTLKIS